MHTSPLHFALALALCAIPLASQASTYDGDCTNKPQSEWLSTSEVRARFEARGFTVGKVKAHGTCYEVYTRDKDGNKVEYFVNPATAGVVGQAGKK